MGEFDDTHNDVYATSLHYVASPILITGVSTVLQLHHTVEPPTVDSLFSGPLPNLNSFLWNGLKAIALLFTGTSLFSKVPMCPEYRGSTVHLLTTYSKDYTLGM